MKIILTLFIFITSIQMGNAQEDTSNAMNNGTSGKSVIISKSQNGSKPKSLVYNHAVSFGGNISTSGWGINGEIIKRITVEKDRHYYWELNFLKNPKQVKKINEYSFSPTYESPKAFIYGKQNSFFAIKFGYGNSFLIGEKADKNGFAISYKYHVGPSIGLIKPYYLDVWYEEDGESIILPVKYNQETENIFLDATSVFGYSGFSKGLNEIKFSPGLFGKSGLNFDWASEDAFVKSIETGIGSELYFQDIPIMIVENNKPYFVYLYLSLQFGKKW